MGWATSGELLIELMLNMHQKDKKPYHKLTNTKLCIFYVINFMFVRNPIRVRRTRTQLLLRNLKVCTQTRTRTMPTRNRLETDSKLTRNRHKTDTKSTRNRHEIDTKSARNRHEIDSKPTRNQHEIDSKPTWNPKHTSNSELSPNVNQVSWSKEFIMLEYLRFSHDFVKSNSNIIG